MHCTDNILVNYLQNNCIRPVTVVGQWKCCISKCVPYFLAICCSRWLTTLTAGRASTATTWHWRQPSWDSLTPHLSMALDRYLPILSILHCIIFVPPTPTSTPSRGPVLNWATEDFPSLDHESGTVYPALCDSLKWTMDSSNNYWRHCFLSETTANLWPLFFDAQCINSFTCTYFTYCYHLIGCADRC